MSAESDPERLERIRRREERRRKREAERAARSAEIQVEPETADDASSFYINRSRHSEERGGQNHYENGYSERSYGDNDYSLQENGQPEDDYLENRRPSRTQLSIKPGEEIDAKSELAEMHERRKQEEERKERQLLEEREAKRQRENEEFEQLKERRERRMREREADEKARKEREKEMQKKAEEEARARKENEERRKAELEEKRRNRENITQNAGIMRLATYLNMKENVRRAKEDAGKSKNELAAQKESAMAERIPPLQTNGSHQEMKSFAFELYEQLQQTLNNVYDLRLRKERQSYDLNELDKRLGVMKNTANKPKILTQVGRVSRFKDIMSEDQNANTVTPKSRFQREREEGSIGKGGVHGRLAMFEQSPKSNTPPPSRGKAPPQVKLY